MHIAQPHLTILVNFQYTLNYFFKKTLCICIKYRQLKWCGRKGGGGGGGGQVQMAEKDIASKK